MKLWDKLVGKLDDQAGRGTVFLQGVEHSRRYQGQLIFCHGAGYASKCDFHIIGERDEDLHEVVPVGGEGGIKMPEGCIDGHIVFKTQWFR